jgi:hypothetical protein
MVSAHHDGSPRTVKLNLRELSDQSCQVMIEQR